MALAIDASTPAVATSSVAACTTASFNPPAGSLLLVKWAGNSTGLPPQPSITDNLGVHLTYTLIDWVSAADTGRDSQAAQWWALVGAGGAMTVTVTNNSTGGFVHAGLNVVVYTGQHATPIGAHGKAGSGSAASIAQSYTAQADSGQGHIAVCDWDALGAETAGTGCTLTNGGSGTIAGQISYGFLRRTLTDDVNGVSNTLNVTLPGTSTHLSWTWSEVVPAASTPTDGVRSTSRHPGRGPSNIRFYQSPRSRAIAGNVVNIDGSLVVTASSTATVAVTHTVSGSLTVTANRTATVAVTHTVGGSLTVTANRTATVAVTHTIGGSRPTTVNRTATVAVTHTISGSRPITVNLAATADVPGVVNISGSLVVTASRTATVSVVHTVSGSLIVVVTRSATADTSQRTYLFLPFFG